MAIYISIFFAGLFGVLFYIKRKKQVELLRGVEKTKGEKVFLLVDKKTEKLFQIDPKIEPFVENTIMYEAVIVKKLKVSMLYTDPR